MLSLPLDHQHNGGEHLRQSRLTNASRHPYRLVTRAELVEALQANDSDTCKRWLYSGIQDLGEPAVKELLLDWLYSFLTVEEQDRLLGWHLGVSL